MEVIVTSGGFSWFWAWPIKFFILALFIILAYILLTLLVFDPMHFVLQTWEKISPSGSSIWVVMRLTQVSMSGFSCWKLRFCYRLTDNKVDLITLHMQYNFLFRVRTPAVFEICLMLHHDHADSTAFSDSLMCCFVLTYFYGSLTEIRGLCVTDLVLCWLFKLKWKKSDSRKKGRGAGELD